MDDDEGRVNDLLEQCVDHAALRLSTGPSDAMDADLLARLQRLKATPLAPSPPLVPHSDSDGLQSDLAERLAALKKDPSKAQASVMALKKDPSKAQAPASQPLVASKKDPLLTSASERLPASTKDSLKASVPEVSKSAELSRPNRHGMHEGDASEVEKLLESVRDCVQLEKLHTSKSNHSNKSDEDVSDSEVDHVVAWAKDAAALEKDEEDDASDGDLSTTPTAADSPQRKKKGNRWKFWAIWSA